MRIANILMPNQSLRTILFLALGYFTTGTYVQAQCGTNGGFNTVWGKCSGSTNTQGSIEMVDANQLPGADICAQIQTAFTNYFSSANTYGLVVDARGVAPPYSCNSAGPWANFTKPVTLPSVVLLPSGTIQISFTWAMPQLARLVGEGPGLTILQASSNGFTGSDMIDMGNSTLCPSSSFNDCPGIAIEHLGLNGGSYSVNGIVNYNGQELSYVQDVTFSSIKNTALALNQYSNNSGPYSNLTMSGVGTCVGIYGTVDTRGIHGLNCTTTSGSSGAAIYVDGSNNSLEDISLTTSNGTDGIVIGDTMGAPNNALFNISGSGFSNLIHISNASASRQNQCPGLNATGSTSAYNACDITIMGVTNLSSRTTTIDDQISGATLSDSNLAMYILGEPVQWGSASNNTNSTFLGNSHFTTSLNWPTWLVGASTPGTGCPTTGSGYSNVGSLYSATSGSSGTLWECESSGWAPVK